MHRLAKSVLVALFAVMCMGALAATSASAGEPLFLTESGKTLLFTADSGEGTLRGETASVIGTIKCEQDLVHGFVLDKSPLIHELHIIFHKKCEQTVSGTKTACTEPISVKLAYGELGLLGSHVYLLIAPESGEEFVKVKCGSNETKVNGAVVGEFKLFGRDGGSQYGVPRLDFLLLFNANSTKQEPEEIELLGVLMKGVALKVTGLFGGKASEETDELILTDGDVTIDP